MKKLLTLIIGIFFIARLFSQSNIANGDMENWYHVVVSTSLDYWQLGTDQYDNYMTTLNELASYSPPIGPGPVTAFRTNDKYNGTYAIKLVSNTFQISDSASVFIEGMLGTAKIVAAQFKAVLGRRCTGCRPLHFTGYYKYEPVINDSGSMIILVSKWNSSTHKRDTIGYGIKIVKDSVTTYTQFDVAVNYNSAMDLVVPDSLTLLCISSAGFNVFNFMGGVGQIGSTMYVDALMLEYPAGIQQNLMPDVVVSVYPNPATDLVNLDLSERVEKGFVEVFSLDGKQVGTYQVTGLKVSIPTYSLTNGSYYFKLRQGNQILNTGSFVIKR